MKQPARLALTVFLFCLVLAPQRSAAAAENSTTMPETVQIIVTTKEVMIGTNFNGVDLYIAGVVENSDPLVRRQNRYDIIVTLESPAASIILRQKKRRMGVWVNADTLTFPNAPLYYALASTRELRDITTPETYRQLGLGIDNLLLRPDTANTIKAATFRTELVRLREQQNLYSEDAGTVAFGSPSLFSARFPLPANVPVGQYTITAYLFRDSAYISQASTQLEITKEHLAYAIARTAHRHSFWYGVAAVLLAVIIGFAGRLLFRKD